MASKSWNNRWMVFTSHCWFVGVSVWSGLKVQIACLESGIDCYDVCHAIDWNDRTPENGYLKCLIKQEPLFRWKQMEKWNKAWTSTHPKMPPTRTNPSLSPSLSEALPEGMLSSRSGMFRRVALSSLWTTIFSLPFDLSISFLASIKERFSVTVPLIYKSEVRHRSHLHKFMKPHESFWR